MAFYLDVNLVAGIRERIAAINTSAGVADAGKIIELDAAGKLDQSFMPTGVGADTQVIEASEIIANGDFVNIFDDGGTIKVQKADASNGRNADGFVKVGVAAAAMATVFFEGSNDVLALLTLGDKYYLDKSTPGGVTNDISAYVAGDLYQYIGKAYAVNGLNFEGSDSIDL